MNYYNFQQRATLAGQNQAQMPPASSATSINNSLRTGSQQQARRDHSPLNPISNNVMRPGSNRNVSSNEKSALLPSQSNGPVKPSMDMGSMTGPITGQHTKLGHPQITASTSHNRVKVTATSSASGYVPFEPKKRELTQKIAPKMPLGHSSSSMHNSSKTSTSIIGKNGQRIQAPKPFQALTRGTSPGYQPKTAAERAAAQEKIS